MKGQQRVDAMRPDTVEFSSGTSQARYTISLNGQRTPRPVKLISSLTG